MTITYEGLVHAAGTWGLMFAVLFFAGVCVYALWPANRAKFDHAAKMPLLEE